ncbi:non-canonical purine NTP pyrophosphatase [Longimicrobium sp.]|jgi:hypothetical protein|uniref:non-canonical purine NTP pyrophosphatase n=1 Tax=Longimicrobium sp. TaxID=2029185 RepID=UPI0032C22D14
MISFSLSDSVPLYDYSFSGSSITHTSAMRAEHVAGRWKAHRWGLATIRSRTLGDEGQTFGELPPHRKNARSHRGRAVRALVQALAGVVAKPQNP